MSSSTIGAIGLGRQSAKDSAATSYMFVPVTSSGLNMNQNVAQLPPEVGGSHFVRGSYKGSVSGGGDLSFVARPTSLGAFLYMLTGQDTVTPVSGQSGAYSHFMTPFAPAAGVDLPWYTFLKDQTKVWGEQYLNSKLSSFVLEVPKNQYATAQTSVMATTPSTVTLGTTSGIATINTYQEVFDNTPQFQSCMATMTLTPQGSNTPITTKLMERFRINLGNRVSDDEYGVGSYYAQDVTLLQRTATVDMDLVVKDASLYQAVYNNGASGAAAWSPTVYRGSLLLTMTNTANVPSTTQPYTLSMYFPGLDFLMMPTGLQGADLVRTTLSTMVTLGPSGADTFQLTLVNGTASY